MKKKLKLSDVGVYVISKSYIEASKEELAKLDISTEIELFYFNKFDHKYDIVVNFSIDDSVFLYYAYMLRCRACNLELKIASSYNSNIHYIIGYYHNTNKFARMSCTEYMMNSVLG